MEHSTTNQLSSLNAVNAASFERASAEFAQEAREVQKVEELSCNQLLKNLLKTNLKLLKLNEISTVLLF
jgi:hypothetical protein